MSEKNQFEVGAAVEWKEGENEHAGTIAEVYTEPVNIEIAGVAVSEDASPENPAYLISLSGSQRTVKSHAELKPAG